MAKLPLNWKIPVGCVDIGEEEIKQVSDVLTSGWVSPGPKVKEFEEKFASLHESKHAVLMNSGTDALRIALATLKEVHGWQDGDEVLVPALTFVATVNVILQNGLKPVFVDVDPVDLNIDFTKVKEVRTDRTRAIIPVHMFGRMADMYQLLTVCEGLKIIEDSCETMGTRWIDGLESRERYTGDRRNKMVGTFGDISCFSTYSCHLIVTGVGGLAMTNNSEYERIMRSYANHGRDPYFLGGGSVSEGSHDPKELIKRRFLYHRVGYSSRVSEFEAAMGIAQIDRLAGIIKKRSCNAKILTDMLSGVWWNGVDGYLHLPPTIPINREHAFMMYPIVIKDDSIDRDEFCLELEKIGIETRPLMPLLIQPVYQPLFGDISKDYPVAYEATTRGFYVGIHHQLMLSDLEYLAESITQVCYKLSKPKVYAGT